MMPVFRTLPPGNLAALLLRGTACGTHTTTASRTTTQQEANPDSTALFLEGRYGVFTASQCVEVLFFLLTGCVPLIMRHIQQLLELIVLLILCQQLHSQRRHRDVHVLYTLFVSVPKG
jgi:hypothetical protein